MTAGVGGKKHENRIASLGERGVAVTDLGSGEGRVFVHGAYWAAEAESRIEKGAPVVVEHVDGLRLRVRKA